MSNEYAQEQEVLAMLRAELPSDVWWEAEHDRPDWPSTVRPHDWRNYVPKAVQDAWHKFSLATRLGIAIIAQNAADREEWE